MKKNFGAKPFIYPQPVLIVASYGEDGSVDAMNVAYGGVVNSNRIQINIGARHKSSENIRANFVFLFLSVAMLLAEGYPAGDHEDCGGEDSYLDKWWVEDHAGGKSYNFYQQINPQVFLCKIYVSAGSTSGVVLIKTRIEPVQIGCRYDYDQAVCSLDHAACTPVD